MVGPTHSVERCTCSVDDARYRASDDPCRSPCADPRLGGRAGGDRGREQPHRLRDCNTDGGERRSCRGQPGGRRADRRADGDREDAGAARARNACKPSDEQIAFVFDEIATGVAAIEAELAKAGGKDKPKRAPRARKEFGTHLERVEIVIEPEVPPGCEGLEKVLIGENVSRRLDVTPAKFRVIVTRRPKYAYRNRDGVVQAPRPPPKAASMIGPALRLAA
jgi:zinc-finger binding domain of transposase IS66